MSESIEFRADEIRQVARRVGDMPGDFAAIAERIGAAAGHADAGFDSGQRLAAVGEECRQSVAALGERVSGQAGRMTEAAEAHETADDTAAADFDVSGSE